MRFITLVMILSACGSDGGTGSAHFSTSVSSSAQLNQLSSSQLTQLCNDLKSFASSSSVYTDAQDAGCRLVGIIAAGVSGKTTDPELQAACTTAYNQCKSQPPETSTMGDTSFACTTAPTTCTATVGELTTCLNDTFNALGQLLRSIPACNQVTKGTLNGDASIISGTFTPPASCTAFESKCSD